MWWPIHCKTGKFLNANLQTAVSHALKLIHQPLPGGPNAKLWIIRNAKHIAVAKALHGLYIASELLFDTPATSPAICGSICGTIAYRVQHHFVGRELRDVPGTAVVTGVERPFGLASLPNCIPPVPHAMKMNQINRFLHLHSFYFSGQMDNAAIM
ncbi:MAG: hypothetical protein H6656_02875 [Ardenticatenaceae bacterium]|nr:hypothetical protein [Ardenticatenaceae bacterium]